VLERHLHRQVRAGLVSRGYLVLKLSMAGRYGSAGWPDLLVLGTRGKVWFLELKSPLGRLTVLQSRRIASLRELGFEVRVVRHRSDVDDL